MKIGAIVPQGWVGEYDGWDAARRLAADDRGRPAGRAARLRVDLAVRPFPHGPPPDRRDHLRVVHDAVRPGRADRARPPRPHRHLHRVPQPGPHGQDDLDDGHDQRRPDGARHRRRLEARRVAGLRLRLPGDEGAAGPAGRRPRGHHARCSPATSTQHATYEGRYAHVRDAINVPKPIQRPRVPIMVGGNGPNVTWRLAARHADELNLDGMSPAEVAEALPVIASRCEEIGRDPATLPVSVHLWDETIADGGCGPGRPPGRLPRGRRQPGDGPPARLGTKTDEALESLVEDARAAGVEFAPPR